MQHRGPDEQREASGENWALGFCRLAILDLSSAGSQPMTSSDGNAWLVFNGEIYNFGELRKELEAHGQRFRSTGDAEVLLYWLKRHGHQGLHRLNGMFAFAYLDLRTRKVLLVRDRVGVKPLVYSFERDRVIFGSELKAVIVAGNLEPEVDFLAVNQYFCLNYVPAPRTIFRGIKKLEPGHFLEVDLDSPVERSPRPFWQLQFKPVRGRSEDHWLQETEALLADSVNKRMVSDVPIGVFLSGGIDSSLITAMMASSNTAKHPVAFTVGFDEPEWDESSIASAVAKRYQMDHRVSRLDPDAWEVLPELVWHYEEPFADSSAVPTYYLCKAASEHATVFLSGDGGDEAFAGYSRYQTARSIMWLDRIPAAIRSAAFGSVARMAPVQSLTRTRALRAAMPTWKRNATQCTFPGDPLNLFPLSPALRKGEDEIASFAYDIAQSSKGLDPLSQLQYLDFKLYLTNDILTKMDRASMAHSIEVRSPFLDYRLIELATTIPADQQSENGQGKRVLRKIAARYLPEVAMKHAKQGFGVPLPVWFRGKTLSRIAEIFSSNAARQRGFYDSQAIDKLIRWQHRSGFREMSHVLWRLLFFEQWCVTFLDSQEFRRSRRAAHSRAL